MGILISCHSQVTKTCFLPKAPPVAHLQYHLSAKFSVDNSKTYLRAETTKAHNSGNYQKQNMFLLTGGHNNVPDVVVYCHHSGIISFQLEHTLKFDICQYNISFKLDQILSN